MKKTKLELSLKMLITCGFTVSAVFSTSALAHNYIKQAKKVFDSEFEELFRVMDPLERKDILGRLEKASPEVQSAIKDSYTKYNRVDYFKISEDGKTALTYSPIKDSVGDPDLRKAVATIIHVDNGKGFTHEMKVPASRRPLYGEIPEEELIAQKMNRDGHYGFALNRDKDGAGLRHKDYVPSVPLHTFYQSGNYEIAIDKRFAVLKDGGSDSRFTLQSELSTHPFGAKASYVKNANGERIWQPPHSYVSLEATVYRDSADAPITKLEGYYRGRDPKQKDRVKFEYELPPSRDGLARQIQDIKFLDNPNTDEQIMQIITTEAGGPAEGAYRITYKVKYDDGKVKLEPIKHERGIDMIEYEARRKPIKGRQVVGANAPQVDVETTR